MKRSFRGALGAACLAATFAVACASATFAQPTPDSYEHWIDRALEAVNAGDWATAYSAFGHAHELEPSARALRGMGVVSFRMGRYARAVSLLQQALQERSKPLDAKLRRYVQRLMDELTPLVARRQIIVNAEPVHIAVDGESAYADASGEIILDPGTHMLRVDADGYNGQELPIDVAAGTTAQIEISLLSQPPDEAPVAAEPAGGRGVGGEGVQEVMGNAAIDPPEPPTRDVYAPPQKGRRRIVTWVALAAVPAFALATGLAWYRVNQIGDALTAHCKEVGCSAAQRDAAIRASQLRTFETLTDIGWALTAASAATACVAFVFESRKPDSSVRLSLSPVRSTLAVGF